MLNTCPLMFGLCEIRSARPADDKTELFRSTPTKIAPVRLTTEKEYMKGSLV